MTAQVTAQAWRVRTLQQELLQLPTLLALNLTKKVHFAGFQYCYWDSTLIEDPIPTEACQLTSWLYKMQEIDRIACGDTIKGGHRSLRQLFLELPELINSFRIGELLAKWHQYRVEMQAWMNQYDVLICPVNAKASYSAGFELDGKSIRAFMYTAAYNMTGWPGAVVRCGTSSDGMPIGVQVVARPWREDICLAVAKHLETAFGGWKKPSI